MSVRMESRSYSLLGAVALGALAEALVRVPGRPGLGVALWAVAGVAVLFVLLRRRSEPAASETRWLVGGALGFASLLVLRDADALAVFSLFAAALLLVMAAGRAAAAWVSHAHVSDLAFAGLRVALLAAAGPIGWRRGEADAASRPSGWVRPAGTVLRGTAMALPALVLLSPLLMSADPVFALSIENAMRFEIEPLVAPAVFIAVVSWLTAGYLRAFLVSDDVVMDRLRVPQPAFAAADVIVALWILNLLFIGFMVVQLRYLFGGADLVQVTTGLTYAEYARRGFFELVATAALVVPILLLADWAAAPDSNRSRLVLRATMLVLVVLLGGVIASAAYRMWLYQDAYGLTELRLYVSVVLVWLTAVLGWLVLTVLRGRRERFAFGSIIAGLVCIAALHALNPHALIARVNLDRAAAGAEFDGRYLRTLSADAVPTLLARLDQLPDVDRDRVSSMLEERWSGERPGGWRTWNLSDWRARRLIAAQPTTQKRSSTDNAARRSSADAN